MESTIVKNIALVCALGVVLVQSRKVSFRTRVQDVDHSENLSERELLLLLGGFRNGRKNINTNTLDRARFLYKALARTLLREDNKKSTVLPEVEPKNDEDTLVEHELEDALSKKPSALQDKPFVQHKGRNDFLVIKTGIQDPFVTVIPNDIYYKIEKRCVNWLDDCNERGIRARLLQRVQSPYR